MVKEADVGQLYVTTAGQSVAMQCYTSVEGHVEWVYYNDSAVKEQTLANNGLVQKERVSRYEVITGGDYNHTLTIKTSNPEDSGLYGCHEQSGQGKVHISCLCVTQAANLPADKKMINCEDTNSNGCVTCWVIMFLSLFFVLMAIFGYCWWNRKMRRRRQKEKSRRSSKQEDNMDTRDELLSSSTGRLPTTAINQNPAGSLDTVSAAQRPPPDVGKSENNTNRSENVGKFKMEMVCTAVDQSNSLIYAVNNDNFYLVDVDTMKIEVHRICEDATTKKLSTQRMPDEDIELKNVAELTKPSCFTASYDNDCLYLGDRVSNKIFKVLPNTKEVKVWTVVKDGEMQSVSPVKNGLAVLVTNKFITDKFWCGVVHLYEPRDGAVPVKQQIFDVKLCLLPHCIGTINDETIVVSWGLANHSGLTVVDSNKRHTKLEADFWLPGHVLYDRKTEMLFVTDAGKMQVGLWKLQFDREKEIMQELEVQLLHQWGDKGKSDYTFSNDSAAQRPLRSAMYNDPEGKYQLIFIAFQNGQIDMYKLTKLAVVESALVK